MMSDYLKTFVNLRARNIRYLFIIDSKTPTEEIQDLFYRNQDFWGGRYNPAIPSYNGVIPEEYIKLASYFDPDYILYPNNFNIDSIKHLFNPLQYIQTNSLSFPNMDGVDSSYLLKDEGYETVLYENNLYKSLPKLYSFYKLNFGFLDAVDNEVIRKFKRIDIGSENQHELNELISFGSLSIISILSTLNVNRPVLQTSTDLSNRIELIVAKEENQFNDLLYYWNRHLYVEYGSTFVNQIYITDKQLDEFLINNNCDAFFAALSGTRDIKISSLSLNKENIESIKNKLNTWQQCIEFHVNDCVVFPFNIDGRSLIKDFDEQYVKQSLVGKSDLVHMPDLSFVNRHILRGMWMIDASIERDSEPYNQISLPIRSKLSGLFCDATSRVNKQNNVTFLVSNDTRYITFKAPTEEQIFRKLIMDYTKSDGILAINTSDDGMRIASLINLFKSNFELIEYFFLSQYWVNIFRGKDSDKESKRMKQAKGIVSFKDLKIEYENRVKICDALYQPPNIDLLKKDLQCLVEIGALFIGNKVKCKNCASKYWYSLSELNELMKCKGCLQNITVPIESEVYYKLNEVIKNCLISNSGTKNDLHGNLTVMLYLMEINNLSHSSFYFLPAQNFYVSNHDHPKSDIDIICMQDGKFIIGEAKNSVKDFNNKEIENLIYLGNEINPDEIVLVFNEGEEDNLKGVLTKIREGLNNKNIQVTSHQVLDTFHITNHIPSKIIN